MGTDPKLPPFLDPTNPDLFPDNTRTGEVFIDNFDRGVVTTLGAIPNSDSTMYVIKGIKDVSPPPDFEGVPVYFAFPDETVDTKILPSIVVRRDSITPAMSRWHLGMFEYTTPAHNAHPVTITNPITGQPIATGYDRYERKDQAVPFDFLYTIECRARFRNNLKVESIRLLQYVLKIYQPYCRVGLIDSLGDTRYYDAFMETPSGVDIMPDVAGKEANFNITLRVEGELDLNDPYVTNVLTNLPTINYKSK